MHGVAFYICSKIISYFTMLNDGYRIQTVFYRIRLVGCPWEENFEDS